MKKKKEKQKKKIIIDKFIKGNPNSQKTQNRKQEILEDMCKIGTIMKKEIIQKKKYQPHKFISISKALSDKNNEQIFCLGILAQNLESMGIETAIEKKGKITNILKIHQMQFYNLLQMDLLIKISIIFILILAKKEIMNY